MVWRQTVFKGLRQARWAELHHFAPKPDFYPLFTVFGAAAATVAYCSYRALALNPDVHLTREHKHDEMCESGITEKRAAAYWDSLFRRAWLHRVHGDKVDSRIHLLP